MINATNNRIYSFNFVRILAALNVFVGHSIAHLKLKNEGAVILKKVFAAFLGVPIFFILSGFLIWASLFRAKTFKQYIRRRIFRLFPELWGGGVLKYNLYINSL